LKATCVLDVHSLLGETPVWSADEKALYWIDCMAPSVHRFRPQNAKDEILPLEIDGYLGSIALCADGGLLVFSGSGLFHCRSKGERRPLAKPDADRPGNLPNDGKCDPQGRFWFGTMHAASAEPTGRLYRYDSARGLAVMDDGFACANGMGWSPDGSIFYFVDMMPGHILAYDFDGSDGSISNRRIFAAISPDEGMPDGLAVDAEGGVWVAHWDGWCLSRFTPDGKRERKIEVPAQRPTCPTFGGDDLRDLYLTSSAADLPAESLARGPKSGGLFLLRSDVAGQETVKFAI
jgi:sugar lactone lactonase YvrE